MVKKDMYNDDMIEYYNQLSGVPNLNVEDTKKSMKTLLDTWLTGLKSINNDDFDLYYNFIQYCSFKNGSILSEKIVMDRKNSTDFFQIIGKENVKSIKSKTNFFKFYLIMRQIMTKSSSSIDAVVKEEILKNYVYYYPTEKNAIEFIQKLDIVKTDGDGDIKLKMMAEVDKDATVITVDEWKFYRCLQAGLSENDCKKWNPSINDPELTFDDSSKSIKFVNHESLKESEEYKVLKSYKMMKGKDLSFSDVDKYLKISKPLIMKILSDSGNLAKLGVGAAVLGAAYVGYNWFNKGNKTKKSDGMSDVAASSSNPRKSSRSPRASRGRKSSNLRKSSKQKGGRRYRKRFN
jgi:hypothetical protein